MWQASTILCDVNPLYAYVEIIAYTCHIDNIKKTIHRFPEWQST